MQPQEKIPYNLEAERSVIACIFLDENRVGEVLNRVGPNDFYGKENKNIMTAIYNLYDNRETPEPMKVIEELRRLKLLEASGGMTYLFDMIDETPSTLDLNSYIEILEEKTLMRELYYASEDIRKTILSGEKTFASIADDVERDIIRIIAQRRTSEIKKIHRFTNQVLDIIESNKAKAGKVLGLDTGFDELNQLTFGFHKGELIILAARPAMGKSALALNIAEKACVNTKANVAFFSLEMGIDQLTMRLFSSMSGLTLDKVRSGKLNATEMTTLLAAKASVDKMNLYLDEAMNNDLGDIKSKCLRLKREGKLDFIVIDYLQLINVGNARGNRTEEVGRISRGLKTMARELDVPVLALSQLSREAEKADRPTLAHLRESGSIEQDADIVMFLHRDQASKDIEVTKRLRNHKTELIIAKNRQGATDSFELMFKGAQSTFTSLERNAPKES